MSFWIFWHDFAYLIFLICINIFWYITHKHKVLALVLYIYIYIYRANYRIDLWTLCLDKNKPLIYFLLTLSPRTCKIGHPWPFYLVSPVLQPEGQFTRMSVCFFKGHFCPHILSKKEQLLLPSIFAKPSPPPLSQPDPQVHPIPPLVSSRLPFVYFSLPLKKKHSFKIIITIIREEK